MHCDVLEALLVHKALKPNVVHQTFNNCHLICSLSPGPTPGFNCTLGHSFLSFSNSKVTLDDLHIHGAIIYILDSNEVTLTNIHLLNTAVQNYVVNSDQLTLRFENVVWESDIPCEVR